MFQRFLKRFIDISGALFGLIVLSPVLLMTAVWIRLTMGTPILFRQQRPGLHGKPFDMLKFRTMTNAKDENGNLFPDEKRLTKFGNFLRKTSIDELPELFNVLKGEMSLVGPRPLAMCYLPYYTEEEMKRHNVKPGITGWAQVNGRNSLIWEEKFKYDIEYVKNQSFYFDVKILFMTVLCVLRHSDIGVRDIGTMIDFDKYRGKQNSEKK
jgi:lipopolysaccharide/colanic/teichoic acid biosynthesis glycosyltransferase